MDVLDEIGAEMAEADTMYGPFTSTHEAYGVLAEEVAVVGEFNDWDPTVHRLLQDRDGTWRLSVELERGQRYRFRYLADRREWINEGSADEYEPTRSGGINAVLCT